MRWVEVAVRETEYEYSKTLRFHDNPEKYNSPDMLLELDKEVP